MVRTLEDGHPHPAPSGGPPLGVRRSGAAAPRRVLPVLLLATGALLAALVLTACGDGQEADDDAAQALDFIVPEAPAPDPQPGAADAGENGAADAEADDAGQQDDQADQGEPTGDDPDGTGPDPQTAALACEAVADLAALGEPGPVEDRGRLGIGDLRDRLVGWQALLEVGHPGSSEAIVQIRLDVLEDTILTLEILAQDTDYFSDIEPMELGLVYDHLSELVAVEDGDGGWLDLVGEPLVNDPAPLLAAGCDQDEVMFVVGRDSARISGLEWPMGAVATDPEAVPFHAALGIGQLVMDPDATDPRAWECPMPAWSEDVQVAFIGLNQWGGFVTCDDLDGLQVTLSANPSFVQEMLGEQPTLGDGVLVAEDGQAVAVRHLDRPVWLVAHGPEDVEVPVDVLIDALLPGG